MTTGLDAAVAAETSRLAVTREEPTLPVRHDPPTRAPVLERPLPQATAGAAPPAVDALVNAAARSTSKRTQTLGVRLADLAQQLRARLAEERQAAEKAERDKAAREAAAAEVTRLEEQLRAARAKLRPARQGGGSSVQRDQPSSAGLDPKAIRAWARTNGVDCPAVGRVPKTVIAAFEAANR